MRKIYRLTEKNGFYVYKISGLFRIYMRRNGSYTLFFLVYRGYNFRKSIFGKDCDVMKFLNLYLFNDCAGNFYKLCRRKGGRQECLEKSFFKREEGERFILELLLKKLEICGVEASYMLGEGADGWMERGYGFLKKIKSYDKYIVFFNLKLRKNEDENGYDFYINGKCFQEGLKGNVKRKAERVFRCEYTADVMNKLLKYMDK